MSLTLNFITQAEIQPLNTALIQDERSLSYIQLHQAAGNLAALIQNRCPRCNRIAIALERGIDATVAIFATLYSGCSYVPLDTKNPVSRLHFIVNDADPQLILGIGNCPEWVDNPKQWVDIGQISEPVANPDPITEPDPEALAAILYTSGSTGIPKGVALSHRAISCFTEWAAATFSISANDRIASLAPFHFDLSTFDIFTSLACGATVNFIPSRLTLAPSRLTAWLKENKITTWYTVPSLLSFITLKGSLTSTHLTELKTILFAGEVFPTPHLLKLTELLPEVDFYNLYGPTETNVCCYWRVDRNRINVHEAIPIGIPASGAELKIDTKTSELQVKSRTNLSGYWQRGCLSPTLKNAYYQTGDKVSLNTNGEFCFHGRLDRMLKCSGYRVEPAEIEHVINSLSEVEICSVIGINDPSSGQRPAAAVVLKPNYALSDIIKPIRQQLPAYMQPVKFIQLKTLPYLSNGKIDYPTLHRKFPDNNPKNIT